MSVTEKFDPTAIQNFDESQKKKIKLVFRGRYTRRMLEHFKGMGVTNSLDKPYSSSYLRQVLTNQKRDRELALNMIEATLLEEKIQKAAYNAFKKQQKDLLTTKQ